MTPDATKLLRSSEMTRCAMTGLAGWSFRVLGGSSDHLWNRPRFANLHSEPVESLHRVIACWLFLHPELVHADECVRVLALERVPETQIDHALVCGKSRTVLLARGSTEVEAQKVQVVVS
jgi:hypothetical protein